MSSPFDLLELPATASLTQIKAAYRLKAAEPGVHPDLGGDTDTFAKLKDAYDRACVIALNAPCVVCGGKGSIGSGMNSFVKTFMRCAVCRGSGKRER